nr:integrase, catalytic region, zinc finger, CCHC-type, peptidase aspartic, catalytic [Tanacetum cinerariifolium]
MTCICGDGKLITCSVCEGMLRGGCCLPCDLKAEKLFIRDTNAYSFNDTSSNSNYLPQPQYENYLCNLCGNNSHDGYDCQKQFSFVYEQKPSYNQNYNDNYYPHDSPSFPCCDNCAGIHETFECQPMDQNIDFSGSDQIQTPQYPDVHPPSQEIKKPKILFQAWYKIFAIQYAQPKDSNELFQKLFEDLQIIKKELIQCNHPTFFDNDEDHLENSSNEIVASNSKQEKEKPLQDFDIRQLIKEECCIEVCKEQKQNMEDTILELVEICQQKSFIEVKKVMEQSGECRTRIVKSLQNFRVIRKSSISLNNTSQISSVHAIAPILSTKEPEYSPSMGYEHPNTTSKTESDEIIKSGVEELIPVLNEYEDTSEDKRECDLPVCEKSPICDDHSEIFSDSNNDDDISSDDDAFEDIEYVEASLPNPKIVNLEEENDVHKEEEEFDLEEIQDVVLREKLLSINRLIANIEYLNDNPTPDCVLNSSASIPTFEEFDISLSDNFSPEFETFCDHSEETRSGNTTTHAHDSLPKYDSLCFEIEPDQERLINVVKNDIFDDSSNDPLLEEADLFLASDNSIPPDAKIDFELDAGEEISFVMNDSDELECLNPRDEFDVSTDNKEDDHFPFMFVIRIFLQFLIYSKVFSFLLSAESEDTIFNPDSEDIQCAGSDHDHYQEAACAHHEEHVMHDCVQLDHIVDSHDDYTSDSNIILCDQYVTDNEVPVIHSDLSYVPYDAFMMIYDDLCEPHDQLASYSSQNAVVKNSLTAELATYREQVELLVISDRNIKEETLKRELHSTKLKLASTINRNKSMVEETTFLKQDFKQKENKYLADFLNMKSLKEKVEDKLVKQDQSLQTVHMLCRPRPLYNDLNKVAIGYKNPLCLTRAKQAQSALYNGHEILKDKHAPAKVHNTEDTLEIAEITRKKMNAKMTDPECVTHKVKIAPHDYSKENLLATFTPQKQLTPEQIYWSNDLMKLKSKALKEWAKVFSVATKSELNIARFTEMHVANTSVEAHCLSLEAELATLRDKSHQENQGELIKHFSKLKVDHLNLQLKYQNLKDSIGNNPPTPDKDTLDFDSVFVIGKMQASLQGKDNAICHLKKQLSQLHKMICLGLKMIKSNSTTKSLRLRFNLQSLREQSMPAIFPALRTVEEAKVVRPLDRSIVSACRYTKHSQELLEYAIGTCPQGSQQRAKQLTHTPLIRKKQVTTTKPSDRQDSNKHKHVVTQKTQKTNVPVSHSTGVKSCPKARGSQPKSNPKTNRILPAKGANKVPVEDLPRTNKSHLRTTNRVDSSSRLKRTVGKVWKPTGKVLTTIGHQWRPTGWILHLGKQCPLTRFTPPQVVVQIVIWYLDSGCSKHMTGDHSRLLNFVKKFIGTVRFKNDHFGAIMGYEDYVVGESVISKVYYVEGLGHNLFSVRQFCDSDLKVAFKKHSCYFRDTDCVDLIKGSRGSNLYTISVEDMMMSSPICLLSKASKNKSWLWH